MQLLGKPVPENISTVIPPSNPNPIVAKKNGKQDESSGVVTAENFVEESMPPIGEEFIEAIEGNGKQTQYKCKLCECTCGDATAKNLHVRGRRHRLTYKVPTSLIKNLFEILIFSKKSIFLFMLMQSQIHATLRLANKCANVK